MAEKYWRQKKVTLFCFTVEFLRSLLSITFYADLQKIRFCLFNVFLFSKLFLNYLTSLFHFFLLIIYEIKRLASDFVFCSFFWARNYDISLYMTCLFTPNLLGVLYLLMFVNLWTICNVRAFAFQFCLTSVTRCIFIFICNFFLFPCIFSATKRIKRFHFCVFVFFFLHIFSGISRVNLACGAGFKDL